MAKILNVSENNYRVKVQSGGSITLDTGLAVGEVYITGNLRVEGNYTIINVSDMTVEDNVIVLNSGETGSGVTEGTSGLTIDRGSLLNAEFLFNESVTHYDPYTDLDLAGTFVMQTSDGNRSGLQISTLVSDGDHNLLFDLQDTVKVLEIVNIDPSVYSAELTDVDTLNPDPATLNYIPNKQFLYDYIQSGVITPGMADIDKIYISVGGSIKSRIQSYADSLKFFVNETLRSQITVSGLDVDNVNIFNNTVTNKSASNLILTANNNNVEVNAILNLDNQASVPLATSGTTKVFSRSQLGSLAQTPGRTGIFFANNITTDELVAKNRALLFSMLF